MSDLNKKVEQLQLVVYQNPLHHAERFEDSRAKYHQKPSGTAKTIDLDAAIERCQLFVNQTPQDHPGLAGRLCNLGFRYKNRFQGTGSTADLDAAIKWYRAAVDKTSLDHLEPAGRRLHSLGIVYYTKFLTVGNITDLDTAIKWFEAAVDQTPTDCPELAGERFRSLGAGYCTRYGRTDNITDLDTAIRYFQAAIDKTPPDHPDFGGRLHSLGAGYWNRYRGVGSTADLDTAIEYFQAGIDQTAPDHSERALRLQCLGIGYHCRYLRTWNITNLDTAIEWYQAAVDQTPAGHLDLAERLHSIGSGYHDRYRSSLRTLDDLDTAIKWYQASVDQTPPDHPALAARIYGIGLGYRDRYERRGNTVDLDAAIECLRTATDQTPLDHPQRTRLLRSLGTGCHSRYRRTGIATDLDTAIQALQEAASVVTSPVLERLRAAQELLHVCAKAGRLKEASSVAYRAMQLVPLLTPRSLNNADKQHLLGPINGLASDSVALVLHTTNDAFDAVRILELGRGVISGSLNEMRTDVTALSSKYPDLGREFIYLRDVLDSPSASTGNSVLSSSSEQPDLRYDAQNKMEKLISDVRSKHGFENFLLAPKREDMQSAAAPGAIVIVNASEYGCGAIAIEQHGIRPIPLVKLNKNDIEKKVRERDFGSSETLCWLWDTIADPVLESLGLIHPPSDGRWSHIWWVPTRYLTRFPLHAAGRHQENSSKAVLDRAMSSYSSSIKALLHHRAILRPKNPQPVPSQALLVAVPDVPGGRFLPYAIEEAATVREVCESMTISPIEPGCRKSDVISYLPQCQIFHFAGHGFTDIDDPSRSFLLLEDWKTDPLSVANLLEVSVRDNLPFLAYLSACGTGQMIDFKLLDESVHLVSAFQLAGFRHVIGTLWEVRDEVCVDIARVTYEGIRDGGMTDESVCLGLHNASRRLRDVWVATKSSRRSARQQSGFRKVSHSDHETAQPARDAVVYEDVNDDDDDEGALSWVPYVHYGV